MPHQCLQCGYAFTEGSSALLAGCPKCKGTRFFYSRDPVSQAERDEIRASAKKDFSDTVTQLLSEAAPETAKKLQEKADADGWATLTAKDLRQIVKDVQKEQKTKPVVDPTSELPVDHRNRRAQVEAARKRILEELEDELKESRPDTVRVEGEGSYSIDIQGLMEHNPLVVHRDGAYVIHLPSLFGKRKE